MPRLRKPQPILLNDDQLYVLYRLTLKLPKGPKWKPSPYELGLIQDAHRVLGKEFSERAREDERISKELQLLDAEYEGAE
jgi:hypothetical protein